MSAVRSVGSDPFSAQYAVRFALDFTRHPQCLSYSILISFPPRTKPTRHSTSPKNPRFDPWHCKMGSLVTAWIKTPMHWFETLAAINQFLVEIHQLFSEICMIFDGQIYRNLQLFTGFGGQLLVDKKQAASFSI